MSLIEMIVAIFIFSLGMAGFSMLFVQSWKQNAYTLEMGHIVSLSHQDLVDGAGLYFITEVTYDFIGGTVSFTAIRMWGV